MSTSTGTAHWLKAHRKALIISAVVVLALQAAYLLAANVFLNSAWGQRTLNRHPERFHVAWTRAYSLYPGHIHASGIRMGGHAGRNRWNIAGQRASGRIKLLPLLARRLSFGKVRADGVAVEFDRDAPLRPPAQHKPGRRAWQLHFDGIHSESVSSLRLDDWSIDQLKGSQLTYAFDKTLGGPIEILPSRLQAKAARIAYKDKVLVRRAKVDFAMTMAPNSRRDGSGFERIRFVDARLELQGAAPGLAMGNRNGALHWSAATAPDGQLAADLALRDGAFQPGGSLHWSAPLQLNDGKNARAVRMQVTAQVRSQGVAIRALVPRQATGADFIDVDLLVPQRRLEKTNARALLGKAQGRIDLDWEFSSLSWLNPMLSEGWLRMDGQARLQAQLRIRDGKLVEGSHARIPQGSVQADLFDTVAIAQARADAVVQADRTRIDFVAERFHLSPHASPAQRFVEGQDLRLQLLASGDLQQFRHTLQASIDFQQARIPDLRTYNRYLPGDSLRIEGGSGTMTSALRLDAQGVVRSGRVQLAGKRVAVRLGPSRIAGDLALDTRIAQQGKDPRGYRIESANLALDHVQAGKDATPDWWARLALANGRMTWREPFRVQAGANLQMKDVSVLLTLFSERSAFPKWVGNIVDAGQVQATAQVSTAGDTVTIDRLQARNERVELLARLRVANGQPSGALYAKWGILGLGVDLRGNQRKFHLRDSRAWYDALPAF